MWPSRVLLFLVLACACVHAQPTPAESDTPRTPGFRTLGWLTQANDLNYEYAGKVMKIAVGEMGRSSFYPRGSETQLRFFRIVPGPDGKEAREEAGVVDLTSAAGPTPLLVFLAAPGAPGRYRVVPLADDLKSFPAANFKFINLTPVALGVEFASQRAEVPSKATHQFEAKLSSPETAEARFAAITAASPNGPVQVYANTWVARPTQRTLVFVVAANGELQVHRIVDDVNAYLPPPPR